MEENLVQEEIKEDYLVEPNEKVRIIKLPYKLPPKLTDLLDGFKWAIHKKKQSAVIVIDGKSGTGKSTLSFQIANYVSKDFNINNVHFTPESFIEGLKDSCKGDVLIFDEGMLLSSRASLSAMNRMIVVAMSMIRSKNLLIIFNVNSIFDLDRNLALSRADLLLHCYGESLTDRGRFLSFFRGADGMDRIKDLYLHGKKYYSYGNPKSNFCTRFSSYFVLDEAEYTKRKDKGVETFLNTHKETGHKYMEQRDRLIFALREAYPDLSLRELSEKLETYKIKLNYNTLSVICSKFGGESSVIDG